MHTSLPCSQDRMNYYCVDEVEVERIEEHIAEDSPALGTAAEDILVVVDIPAVDTPVADNPAADNRPFRTLPADNLQNQNRKFNFQ